MLLSPHGLWKFSSESLLSILQASFSVSPAPEPLRLAGLTEKVVLLGAVRSIF